MYELERHTKWALPYNENVIEIIRKIQIEYNEKCVNVAYIMRRHLEYIRNTLTTTSDCKAFYLFF